MKKQFPWIWAIIAVLLIVGLNSQGLLEISGTSGIKIYQPVFATLSCVNSQTPRLSNFQLTSGTSEDNGNSIPNSLLTATCSHADDKGEKCTVQQLLLAPRTDCYGDTRLTIYKDDILQSSGYYGGDWFLCSDGQIKSGQYGCTTVNPKIFDWSQLQFGSTFKIKLHDIPVQTCDNFKSASGTFNDYYYQLQWVSGGASGVTGFLPNTYGCYWSDVDRAIDKASASTSLPLDEPSRTESNKLATQYNQLNPLPALTSGIITPGSSYTFVIGYQLETSPSQVNTYTVNGQLKYCLTMGDFTSAQSTLVDLIPSEGAYLYGTTKKNVECCNSGICASKRGTDYACDQTVGSSTFLQCAQTVKPSCYTVAECGTKQIYNSATGKYHLSYDGQCTNGKCVYRIDKDVDEISTSCDPQNEAYSFETGSCISTVPQAICPSGACCVGKDQNSSSPYTLTVGCPTEKKCSMVNSYLGTCVDESVTPPVITPPQTDCNGLCDTKDKDNYLITIGESGIWRTTTGTCPADCEVKPTDATSTALLIIGGIFVLGLLVFLVPALFKKKPLVKLKR